MTKTYLSVSTALMILLAATFWLSHVPLGKLSLSVALAIAFAKAALVAIYFMHLNRSPGLMRIAAVAGLFWLGILISLTMTDYVSRNWLKLPGHWPQEILLKEVKR